VSYTSSSLIRRRIIVCWRITAKWSTIGICSRDARMLTLATGNAVEGVSTQMKIACTDTYTIRSDITDLFICFMRICYVLFHFFIYFMAFLWDNYYLVLANIIIYIFCASNLFHLVTCAGCSRKKEGEKEERERKKSWNNLDCKFQLFLNSYIFLSSSFSFIHSSWILCFYLFFVL